MKICLLCREALIVRNFSAETLLYSALHLQTLPYVVPLVHGLARPCIGY